MKVHIKRRIPVILALGVLMLIATGEPLASTPTAQGAAIVLATVPSGGTSPGDVAVNPVDNLVYVTNYSTGELSILRGDPPFAPAAPTIDVGGYATGVAYNSNSNVVFVADDANAVIKAYLAVDPFSMLGATTATVPRPVKVAVNPNINRIYVTSSAPSPFQPSVAVFDGTAPNFPFVAYLPQPPCAPGFPADGAPYGVAVNPTTNQIYVTEMRNGQLWIMDGGAPWGCRPPVAVGPGAAAVAYNPVNNHIYVTNVGSDSVTVIDASTLAVLGPSLAVGDEPRGAAVNPTTNHIYVTNMSDNSVSVIDGSTDTVVQTLPVGNGPDGVAANPVTNLVFVANTFDDTVSVIEDVPVASPPPEPAPPAAETSEQMTLQGGTCTPVASTYPDATPIGDIAVAVAPPGVLESLWEFDGVTWLGYSPQFPAASNLKQMDRLDVVFICIGGSGPGAGTFSRPVI
jgi:YVTN family beta-propeller protein